MIVIKLTAFSQRDTDTVQTKCFTIPVVKTIIKDLISGDSAKAALYLTEQELVLNQQKNSFKDSIIKFTNEKVITCEKTLSLERVKYESLLNYTKTVEDNFNKVNLQLTIEKGKNRTKNWIIGSGFTIALGYTAYYLLFMR